MEKLVTILSLLAILALPLGAIIIVAEYTGLTDTFINSYGN